jgi:hypothetical protein
MPFAKCINGNLFYFCCGTTGGCFFTFLVDAKRNLFISWACENLLMLFSSSLCCVAHDGVAASRAHGTSDHEAQCQATQ